MSFTTPSTTGRGNNGNQSGRSNHGVSFTTPTRNLSSAFRDDRNNRDRDIGDRNRNRIRSRSRSRNRRGDEANIGSSSRRNDHDDDNFRSHDRDMDRRENTERIRNEGRDRDRDDIRRVPDEDTINNHTLRSNAAGELIFEQDGPGGVGLYSVKIKIPAAYSRQMAQALANQVFKFEARVYPKKRRYDNQKFGHLFDNGQEVYNALIWSCKLHFVRFIYIDEKLVPIIVDRCVGRETDKEAGEYKELWDKIGEWRRNWSSAFNRQAQAIQEDIQTNNVWGSLTLMSEITAAYKSKFSHFHVEQLFQNIAGRAINWPETLRCPIMKSFYVTIFTWTMVYHHRARAGEISRIDCLDRIKVIALAKEYDERIQMNQYVMMPERPVAARKYSRKRKFLDPTELDPEFEALDTAEMQALFEAEEAEIQRTASLERENRRVLRENRQRQEEEDRAIGSPGRHTRGTSLIGDTNSNGSRTRGNSASPSRASGNEATTPITGTGEASDPGSGTAN